jgi:catalase
MADRPRFTTGAVARFSAVAGEPGAERCVRSFALKFGAQEGNRHLADNTRKS